MFSIVSGCCLAGKPFKKPLSVPLHVFNEKSSKASLFGTLQAGCVWAACENSGSKPRLNISQEAIVIKLAW